MLAYAVLSIPSPSTNIWHIGAFPLRAYATRGRERPTLIGFDEGICSMATACSCLFGKAEGLTIRCSNMIRAVSPLLRP